jgi:hypothetical protein
VVFSMVHKKQSAQGPDAKGAQATDDSASPEMLHAH